MSVKIIKQETVYRGKFLNVRRDTFSLNGHQLIREIIESAGGVLIAAITNSQQIILVKQHRHNYGYTYELPGGAIDHQETPLQAAKRELLEESGITANHWQLMSRHHNGAHHEGLHYFFLASNLSINNPLSKPDELIDGFEYCSFQHIDQLIKQNKIPDLRNRACIWKAQLILSKQ